MLALIWLPGHRCKGVWKALDDDSVVTVISMGLGREPKNHGCTHENDQDLWLFFILDLGNKKGLSALHHVGLDLKFPNHFLEFFRLKNSVTYEFSSAWAAKYHGTRSQGGGPEAARITNSNSPTFQCIQHIWTTRALMQWCVEGIEGW